MSEQIAKTNELKDLIERTINNSSLADSTKYQYRKQLLKMLEAGISFGDALAIENYSKDLCQSNKRFLGCALSLLCKRTVLEAKATATPDNALSIMAMTWRADALREVLHVKQPRGTKLHNWLSPVEVKALMDACSERMSGRPEYEIITMRDRLVIALMVGAGLRRHEVIKLTIDNIQVRTLSTGKQRTIINVIGKGDKARQVPVSESLAALIEFWRDYLRGTGFIVRALGRTRIPSNAMTAQGVYNLLRKRAKIAGVRASTLSPHDLRRTFAQISIQAGVKLHELAQLLGHASIETTRGYLDDGLNVDITASDFIQL